MVKANENVHLISRKLSKLGEKIDFNPAIPSPIVIIRAHGLRMGAGDKIWLSVNSYFRSTGT